MPQTQACIGPSFCTRGEKGPRTPVVYSKKHTRRSEGEAWRGPASTAFRPWRAMYLVAAVTQGRHVAREDRAPGSALGVILRLGKGPGLVGLRQRL